jgi:uncharacterized membrane protein
MGNGINDLGQIVGVYLDGTGFHSFLDKRGVFTTIDPPGQVALATSINNLGQIAGSFPFCDDTGCPGFLDTNGVFTTISVPGAIYTVPEGINDLGQIVGIYADSAGLPGAFLATPKIGPFTFSAAPLADPVPEPSIWAMMLMGLAGLAFVGSRARASKLAANA